MVGQALRAGRRAARRRPGPGFRGEHDVGDERAVARPVRAQHHGLGDRRVRRERRLDLPRLDPEARILTWVGAAQELELAVGAGSRDG